MPSRRTNKFPESGRGLGHVTHTIFGSTVGYPSDSLASCFKKASMRQNVANDSTTTQNESIIISVWVFDLERLNECPEKNANSVALSQQFDETSSTK